MTESWHLYLAGSRLLVRRVHGLLRRQVEQVAELDWDRAQLPPPQMRRPGEGAERPLYVYVGSSMLRWGAFRVGLQDSEERLTATRACMQAHYGMDHTEWAVQAQADGAGGYVLACAMRQSLLDELHRLAQANALRLVSVHPYVQAVWNTFLATHRRPATLVTVESDAFTIMVSRAGEAPCISSFCHQQQVSVLERELARVTMTGANAAGQAVHIAVPGELLQMLGNGPFQSRALSKTSYLRRDLYADFRDLAFCGGVPG